jgi:hypothetical protein
MTDGDESWTDEPKVVEWPQTVVDMDLAWTIVGVVLFVATGHSVANVEVNKRRKAGLMLITKGLRITVRVYQQPTTC